MSVHVRAPSILATLVLFATACGSGGAPPPAVMPTPVAVVPETVVVERGVSRTPAVEPGRFDTGKMWTFENPPLEYFQEAYGFRPTQEWLTQARLAALRLPNCTASFVSSDGLVMSNHHCAREGATAVTREGEDLLNRGFFAAQRSDERRVPDLYIDQLVELRDVTPLVDAAAPAAADEATQQAARQQRIEAIADSAGSALGLSCDVTTLYHGGRHSLYCYRRYDDVRLVFVPELQMGFFGGDPDNFTYPRYAFDVSFFRVYDANDQPLRPQSYFRWSRTGAKEGDPVFVIGNPGSTSRLNTVAQLEYKRDVQYPFTIRLIGSRATILQEYMRQHPESRSTHINDYFSLTNALKAFSGELRGLRTPELMGRKVGFERQFRGAVQRDPGLARQYGGLWDEIADIRRQIAQIAPRLNGLNQGGLLRSQTFETAASMIQYAQAALSGQAPDSLLREFRQELEAATIDPALDAEILAAQLGEAAELLGDADPFVRQALAGRSPAVAARTVVIGSAAVTDRARRAALLANPSDIMSSTDPALRLMRDALPRLRELLSQIRQLQSAEEARTARLARALFDVYGTAIPPDATFTLRIADGMVAGYEYNGTSAPAFTTFYGLYDRHYSHRGEEEWALPEQWRTPPRGFDLSTPLNLVSTNDIIGGNSGSPLINTDREIVGLIFDGNVESLPGDFIYTTETARAVSVHAAAILEALRHVYGATRIVNELLGQGR